jgi:hypothetical protein
MDREYFLHLSLSTITINQEYLISNGVTVSRNRNLFQNLQLIS